MEEKKTRRRFLVDAGFVGLALAAAVTLPRCLPVSDDEVEEHYSDQPSPTPPPAAELTPEPDVQAKYAAFPQEPEAQLKYGAFPQEPPQSPGEAPMARYAAFIPEVQ